MKLRGKVDANQSEIVQALRAVGASVAITSSLGNGFPDLVVGFRQRNYLLEVKDGNKPPSKRLLTEEEQRFFKTWSGSAYKVESVTDALTVIGVR